MAKRRVAEEEFGTKDAAEHLEIEPRTVRLYCQQGRLGRKVGGRYLITLSEIKTFKGRDRIGRNPRHHHLDESQVRKIRRLSKKGMSLSKIASEIGTDRSNVSRVLNGKRWAKVNGK